MATPMMEQFAEIKKQYPDCLVFFRLGDFYEMFGDDAIEGSKLLEITLTGRNKGDNRTPMCGVPYHSAEGYLAKLTKLGKKVAICEQIGDPKGPGIVKREVTRVVTPGTTFDEGVLESKCNNFLVCVMRNRSAKTNMTAGALGRDDAKKSFEKERQNIGPMIENGGLEVEEFALAAVDLTTGEFRVTELKGFSELRSEIVSLRPSELIFDRSMQSDRIFQDFLKEFDFLTTFPVDFFHEAGRFLRDHFKMQNLEAFGIENKSLPVEASSRLLFYLKETQKTALLHITGIRFYEISEYMMLDEATIRNLELMFTIREGQRKGALASIIDQTVTAMGGRLLKFWLLHALKDAQKINLRLNGVEAILKKWIEFERLRDELKKINDMERVSGKVGCQTVNARDLIGLRESLRVLPKVQELLKILAGDILKKSRLGTADMENISETLGSLNGVNLQDFNANLQTFDKEIFESSILKKCAEQIENFDQLCVLLETSLADEPALRLNEGGLIREGFDKELDDLRAVSTKGKDFILELQNRERKRSGISNMKVKFNRVFGYYIEISRGNLKHVPEDYIRKQTLVNAERFITPELKEYEEKVLGAEEKIKELEYRLFLEIRGQVAVEIPRLISTAKALAVVDVLGGFAWLARHHNYVKPEVSESDVIDIRDGRHPVIEQMTAANEFVPNDVLLDNSRFQLNLLTGPNMSGKSTFLRQVALIVLLAQIGSYVPAREARIGIVDRIFTRVGASDNLARGQSTFMVEMQETSHILHHATAHSLIILDEVGRGTSTYDGVSIAWAITEFLHDQVGAKTIFATHYHELTPLAAGLKRGRNLCVSVRENEVEGVVFLHKILEGVIDKSYGIEVAKLAGLPQSVTARANDILKNLEEGIVDKYVREEASLAGRKVSVKDGQSRKHRGIVSDEQLALFLEQHEKQKNPKA